MAPIEAPIPGDRADVEARGIAERDQAAQFSGSFCRHWRRASIWRMRASSVDPSSGSFSKAHSVSGGASSPLRILAPSGCGQVSGDALSGRRRRRRRRVSMSASEGRGRQLLEQSSAS